jgi:hypothetical protein
MPTKITNMARKADKYAIRARLKANEKANYVNEGMCIMHSTNDSHAK